MGLEDWLPLLVPYTLEDEVDIRVSSIKLNFCLWKVRYDIHLQWDSMHKVPTSWVNIYGDGSLGMADNIYSKYVKTFTSLEYPKN